MTTGQLLRQLHQQMKDLRYRERRALAWLNQDEQNRLYGLGALAVIQSEIGDILSLIEQLEREGITDANHVLTAPSPQYNHSGWSTEV